MIGVSGCGEFGSGAFGASTLAGQGGSAAAAVAAAASLILRAGVASAAGTTSATAAAARFLTALAQASGAGACAAIGQEVLSGDLVGSIGISASRHLTYTIGARIGG